MTEWSELTAEERLARKFSMEQSEEKRVEVPLPDVVVPGHEVEAEFLPKQPAEIRALLERKGRTVATRHSQTRVRGVEYKSGAHKGEMRPDKYIDHYGLATVDYEFPVVYAVWAGADSLLMVKVVEAKGGTVNSSIGLVTHLKRFIEETHA